MKLPKVIPYHPKDAHHILRHPESIMVGETHDDGYTIEVDGEIMCCVGVDYQYPGIGTVWMIMSPLAGKYPRVVWALKILLKERMKTSLRLQAYIRTDWETAVRFVEHFGFQREGLLRKADPHGNDYYLYALVG